MADRAHEWTDEQIERLNRRLAREYSQAAMEMRTKLNSYLEDYEYANQSWKDAVRSGEATREEYRKWLASQASKRRYVVDMTDMLANDAFNTSQRAFEIINDALPQVYAENANWAAYSIENGIGRDTGGFALYDQSTVRRLMLMDENDQVIHEVIPVGPPNTPLQSLRVNLDAAKDVRWNRQKFTSAITQSILQGESIPNTAKRLAGVLNMDKNMATRAARTAMTSAENAGRVDSYERAKRIGIDLEQEWMATLDERTRTSHRLMDGQHVPVGQKFSNGLRFPADPSGDGSEIWNCFIGETTICADSQIEKSYCHEYKGELVTIDTAAGVHFTCTPNHPILTISGWVPAKSLHDGDNLLITGVRDVKVSRGNPHIDHVFPSMKALHELLCVLSSKRAAGLSVNFHGDAAASNVEVVAKESLLRLNLNTGRIKRIVELALKGTDPFHLGKRPSMEGILRVPLSVSRIMRRLRVCASLLWGHGLHADIHGLRASTRLDSSVAEYAIDNLPAETMVRSELLSGLSGQVLSDEVIGVKVGYTRATQVYNLQTGNGYYFANQSDNGNFIIAKNCRCTLVAWLPNIENEDNQRWSRLPKGMTYDDWKAGIKAYGKKAKSKTPSTLENFIEYEKKYIESNRTSYRLDDEQMEHLKNMVGKMFDESEVYAYVSGDAIQDLVRGGHLMNILELSTDEAYNAERRALAEQLFGANASKLGAKEFEKYGFLGSKDAEKVLGSGTNAQIYGDICVRFRKDKIKDRTTYTFGDSFNEVQRGSDIVAGGLSHRLSVSGIQPSEARRTYVAMSKLEESSGLDATDVTQRTVGRYGYIEAQLHGMLESEEIETAFVKCKRENGKWVPKDGGNEFLDLLSLAEFDVVLVDENGRIIRKLGE